MTDRRHAPSLADRVAALEQCVATLTILCGKLIEAEEIRKASVDNLTATAAQLRLVIETISGVKQDYSGG